jgi:hypothetical protein
VVGPLWPCVTSGIEVLSSASCMAYFTITMSSLVTFGISMAVIALRTSSPGLSPTLYQILSGSIVQLPFAGTMAA